MYINSVFLVHALIYAPPPPHTHTHTHTQRKKRAEGGIPISVDIGGVDDCGPEDEVCNGPLVPGTDYSVGYRLFTGNQSTDYEFPMNATFSTGTVHVCIDYLLAEALRYIISIILTPSKEMPTQRVPFLWLWQPTCTMYSCNFSSCL